MYIRFKDIPENERSGIYDWDKKIGEEIGVSCFEYIKKDDEYRIILPSSNEALSTDLYDFFDMAKSGKYPIYLIDGDIVGYGSCNEPLLVNIKVIKKLKLIEKNKARKYKTDRSNSQIVD
jgi:hypothetical protein